LAEPDRGGLDEAQHDRVFYGLQYGLGLLEAVCGSEASQHRAKLLDDKRELRVNAWRVRALLDLARGDSEGWIKSSRRAQLLQAQEGLRERYLGATAGVELALQHRLGDMIAVKRVLDQVSRLARAHSCWQAVELFGRAAYAELQHDPDAALSAIETALALAPPLQLPFYSSLVSCRINVLVQLGRAAEAAEHARRDVAFCDAHDVFAQDLRRFGALALTIAGDAAHGLAMWRASLESAQRLHSVGYSIGAVYETGLRIAIELRDMQLFEECRQACVEQLEQVRNVNVNAKLAGLYELARVRGLIASDMIEAAIASRTIPAEDDDYEVIHSRIAECLDGVDRGRCALTLLLQDTVTPAGLLYTSDNNYRLTLLAALPDVPESSDTTSWLTHVVTDWLEAVSSDVTESVAADATETSALDSNVHTHVDADGKHWQAVPLVCDRVSSRVLAGVLVLQVEAAQVITLPPALTANVARELLEHGDAEGRPVLMI
jgi:tetratricopeptide (TPR) repeat protein